MRKPTILAICFACLAACAFAQPRAYPMRVYVGPNNTGTSNYRTPAGARGAVEAIYIAGYTDENNKVATATTGTVAVTVAPFDGLNDSITLASATVSDGKTVIRPRFDGETSAGSANTEDPPERFNLAGELLTLTVTGSATGGIWVATIIVD